MAGMTPDMCPVEELLSAYVDGELQPGEIDTVAGHLPDCATCGPAFRALKDMRSAVRGLEMVELPDRLVEAVLEAFAIPLAHAGDKLSAYLDGEITGTELEAVTTHLVDCAECRDELHEIDGARTAIRALPRIDPPVFVDAPHQQVAPDDPAATGTRPAGRSARSRRLVVAAAAAAVITVTVAVSFGGDTAPATIDLDRLAERHVARVAVGSGASVIPAVAPRQGSP